MSSGISDVQVFVRVRPTPNFAQDIITLGEDNKVRPILILHQHSSLNIETHRGLLLESMGPQVGVWAPKTAPDTRKKHSFGWAEYMNSPNSVFFFYIHFVKFEFEFLKIF